MLGHKILIIVGLVLCLSCAALAKRGGSRSRRTSSSGGGGGGGLDTTTTVLIIIGVIVLAVVVVLCKCWCRSIKHNIEEDEKCYDEDGDYDGADGHTVTGRKPVIDLTTTTPRLRMVKMHCSSPISEDEEIAIHEQYQIWLNEAKEEGKAIWYARRKKMYEFDKANFQNKRIEARFLALYCHKFGDHPSCNRCGIKLKEEWYRCRICEDVNLCTRCFEDGPSILECDHVPSHECAYLHLEQQCTKCKGFIPDTMLRCDTCQEYYEIYFCLGCYKMGMHERDHGGHDMKRIDPVSYVMVQDNPQDEFAALLPRNVGAQPSAPYNYAPSGLEPGPYPTPAGQYTYSTPEMPSAPAAAYQPPEVPSAPHMSSTYPQPEAGAMPVPEVPPPSYEDCTETTKEKC